MKSEARKVRILTKNKYLFQKLYLELSFGGEFIITDTDADITLCDVDTEKAIPGAILMSYKKDECDVLLPERLGKIRKMLLSYKEVPLRVNENERCAVLFGEKIKLTEIEYALFSLLYKRGTFVSREEILSTVWTADADSGIINVYVHYLREKLEKGGEKIIISSRKLGYRISERYLGGEAND
ncbi:MAG: winged helix-turn-helix transcriptional regulator [Clostridia bacterium]|nr:winged helix-turn-helix transcriptional regulator [Clostridia bacterium]